MSDRVESQVDVETDVEDAFGSWLEITHAARSWDSLTSDENIEAAAEAILDRVGKHEHTEKEWRHAVELVTVAFLAVKTLSDKDTP